MYEEFAVEVFSMYFAFFLLNTGFPIGIPLGEIAQNCVKIKHNCMELSIIALNCAELKGSQLRNARN